MIPLFLSRLSRLLSNTHTHTHTHTQPGKVQQASQTSEALKESLATFEQTLAMRRSLLGICVYVCVLICVCVDMCVWVSVGVWVDVGGWGTE